MFGGKVEVREQRLLVLAQRLDGLRVFGAVVGREAFEAFDALLGLVAGVDKVGAGLRRSIARTQRRILNIS